MKKQKIAIYAGSFDPVTNGHLWVIQRAARLFDNVIVAIGDNPSKEYLFTIEERQEILENALEDLAQVSVQVLGNKYLAKYASEERISYLVRGIRSAQDFEYEKSMAHINLNLAPDVETIYLIPPLAISQISSSMVKGLVGPEGWEDGVKKYVPKGVAKLLKKKFSTMPEGSRDPAL